MKLFNILLDNLKLIIMKKNIKKTLNLLFLAFWEINNIKNIK